MTKMDAPSLTSYDPSLSRAALLSPPQLISFHTIESALSNLLLSPSGAELILSSQADAYRLSSSGACAALPIQTAGQIPQPPLRAGAGAQMCIKTGYAHGDAVLVSKAAAGDGRGNNTGAVSVYSQTSLRLTAVLCDGGILTEARTAAASAYACRAAVRRAKATVTGVGIVGGGVQAVWQLRLLGACGAVDPAVAQVVVKTRSRASAEAFVRRMAASSFPPDRRWRFAHFEDSVRFRRCQLVLTLTTSRSPVLGMEDVALAGNAFLHVSAVGSDSPGKCEISTELLSSADLLLVDSIAQSKERGEFQPGRWGEGTVPDLVEIGTEGTVVNGALAAGTDRHLFTVFDSSGIAMQDVQMAKLMAGHLQSGAS